MAIAQELGFFRSWIAPGRKGRRASWTKKCFLLKKRKGWCEARYLCTVWWRGGRLAWKIHNSHEEGEDGRNRQEKQVMLDLTSNLANLYWNPSSITSGRLVEIVHLECGCYAGVIWSRDVDMMCWGIFHHQAGNQEAHLKKLRLLFSQQHAVVFS